MDPRAEKLLKKGVKCPYCESGGIEIEVKQTTVTLLFPIYDLPPTYDPNTYSTEYKCHNCKRPFWISRKVKLIEEYVFKEKGKIKRVRKE